VTPNWQPGKGDLPRDLLGSNSFKHRDIRTISLIRETLWNKALWCGTAFLTPRDGLHPPVLALMFRNADAAREIFENWRTELGFVDNEERLRIAIIRGIRAAEPHWYRILVGSNPEGLTSHRFITLINRIHTMCPDSSVNLDRFLEACARVEGSYYLAPAIGESPTIAPEVISDCVIAKRKIYVRSAWEIGRHDLDSAAIQDEDSPIVPAGTTNAPITDLLRWRREKRN
jgi:hypothetical protein